MHSCISTDQVPYLNEVCVGVFRKKPFMDMKEVLIFVRTMSWGVDCETKLSLVGGWFLERPNLSGWGTFTGRLIS